MKNIKNIFTFSSQRKNLNNTFLIPSPDRRGLGGGNNNGLGGGIKNTKAFTLVELIIVITILAILATIAFISFQGFAKNARDGNRLATLKQIQNGLEVFATKTGYYPDPEGNILTGSINGITFSNKGIFGDNSSRIIQASKTPTDPLNNSQYYIYALDSNKKQYQIATILETLNANNNFNKNNYLSFENSNLIQETYAGNEGNYKSYVVGNYKGYIKYSSGSLTYLANIPSLIWNNTGSVDLLSGLTYFVANKSLNLPYKPNNDTNINISNGDEIIKQITGNQEGVLTGVNISPVLAGTSVDSWLNSFGSNSGIILKSFTSLDNLSNGAKNLELAINGSVSVGNNGDTQAPTGGNFTMSATTSSTSVTLTITCPTDAAGSTPIQMYISGTGVASGGNVWETCATNKNITVTSGDGSKAITMKWRDSLNNETSLVSRNVSLTLFTLSLDEVYNYIKNNWGKTTLIKCGTDQDNRTTIVNCIKNYPNGHRIILGKKGAGSIAIGDRITGSNTESTNTTNNVYVSVDDGTNKYINLTSIIRRHNETTSSTSRNWWNHQTNLSNLATSISMSYAISTAGSTQGDYYWGVNTSGLSPTSSSSDIMQYSKQFIHTSGVTDPNYNVLSSQQHTVLIGLGFPNTGFGDNSCYSGIQSYSCTNNTNVRSFDSVEFWIIN